MFLHVIQAKYIEDYKIEVLFNDGKKGVANLVGILNKGNIHKNFFYFTIKITIIFIFSSFLYLFNPEYSLLTEYGYKEGVYQGLINHLKLIVSEPLHFLFTGTAAHLWFLPSLVIGITILYIFLISGQKKKLLVGSIFLYAIVPRSFYQ